MTCKRDAAKASKFDSAVSIFFSSSFRNSSPRTFRPEPPKPSSEPPIIQPAEVVLPSTATVIELPDNHSISSAPLASQVPRIQFGVLTTIQTSTQPYPGLSVHPTAHQPYYALPQTTTRPPTVQTQYRAPYGSTNTFAYHPAPNQAPQRGQPVQPVFRLNEHTHYTPQHNLRGAPGPPQRNEHLQQPINPTVGQRPSADYYGTSRLIDKAPAKISLLSRITASPTRFEFALNDEHRPTSSCYSSHIPASCYLRRKVATKPTAPAIAPHAYPNFLRAQCISLDIYSNASSGVPPSTTTVFN